MTSEDTLRSFLRPQCGELLETLRTVSRPLLSQSLYAILVEILRTVKYAAKIHRATPANDAVPRFVTALGLTAVPGNIAKSFTGWVFELRDVHDGRYALKVTTPACIENIFRLAQQAECFVQDSLSGIQGGRCADLVVEWLQLLLSQEMDLDRERRLIERVVLGLPSIQGVRVMPVAPFEIPLGTLLLLWTDGAQIENWNNLGPELRISVRKRLHALSRALNTYLGLVRLDTHTSNFRIQPDGTIDVFDWSTVLESPPHATVAASDLALPSPRSDESRQLLVSLAQRDIALTYADLSIQIPTG
jgi:ABC1 atypical kinase-like domain